MKTLSVLTCVLLCQASVNAATTFQVGAEGTALNTNNWPGGEPPANAVDGGTGNKYLNFGITNTGYIISYSAAQTATGLFISTGGDAEERDPLTFSLYGSNTAVASTAPGTNYDYLNPAIFTPIVIAQSTGLTVDPGRNTAAPIQPSFANGTAYNTYLLFFPTVRNAPNPANSMQIGEARLTGLSGSPTFTVAGGQVVSVVIPEPSTLFLLSLSVLGMLRRRR